MGHSITGYYWATDFPPVITLFLVVSFLSLYLIFRNILFIILFSYMLLFINTFLEYGFIILLLFTAWSAARYHLLIIPDYD